MSYEEAENFELCGVSYRATRQQANKIMLAAIDTQQWINYARTSDLIQHGDFDPHTKESQSLIALHIDNYRAAFKEALRVIDSQIGDGP